MGITDRNVSLSPSDGSVPPRADARMFSFSARDSPLCIWPGRWVVFVAMKVCFGFFRCVYCGLRKYYFGIISINFVSIRPLTFKC
jgi:hypothetical protein